MDVDPTNVRKVLVAPRMGRVSRNVDYYNIWYDGDVAPRMGRVSRNHQEDSHHILQTRRAPHGACE